MNTEVFDAFVKLNSNDQEIFSLFQRASHCWEIGHLTDALNIIFSTNNIELLKKFVEKYIQTEDSKQYLKKYMSGNELSSNPIYKEWFDEYFKENQSDTSKSIKMDIDYIYNDKEREKDNKLIIHNFKEKCEFGKTVAISYVVYYPEIFKELYNCNKITLQDIKDVLKYNIYYNPTKNCTEVVIKILETNIFDINEIINEQTGTSLIFEMCRHNRINMAKYILEKYPNVILNRPDKEYGSNILQFVLQNATYEILELLLKKDNDTIGINHKNNAGFDVLHFVDKYNTSIYNEIKKRMGICSECGQTLKNEN